MCFRSKTYFSVNEGRQGNPYPHPNMHDPEKVWVVSESVEGGQGDNPGPVEVGLVSGDGILRLGSRREVADEQAQQTGLGQSETEDCRLVRLLFFSIFVI